MRYEISVEIFETVYVADVFYVDPTGVTVVYSTTVIVERTIFICSSTTSLPEYDMASARPYAREAVARSHGYPATQPFTMADTLTRELGAYQDRGVEVPEYGFAMIHL